MSNTLGDYGTPPDPLNVRLPDPRDARIAELEAALRRTTLTAEILLMNAQACMAQHHGVDVEKSQPGWFNDCSADIEFARAALSTKEDGT